MPEFPKKISRKFPVENFPKISGNFLEISKIFSKILNFFDKFLEKFFKILEVFEKNRALQSLVGYKKVITFLNRRLLSPKKAAISNIAKQNRKFPEISTPEKISRKFHIEERFRKFPPFRKFPEILHHWLLYCAKKHKVFGPN